MTSADAIEFLQRETLFLNDSRQNVFMAVLICWVDRWIVRLPYFYPFPSCKNSNTKYDMLVTWWSHDDHMTFHPSSATVLPATFVILSASVSVGVIIGVSVSSIVVFILLMTVCGVLRRRRRLGLRGARAPLITTTATTAGMYTAGLSTIILLYNDV